MAYQHGEFVFINVVQDAVDGVVTGDVLYLSAAEVVLRRQRLGVSGLYTFSHRFLGHWQKAV